jgi:hypothetical protein
MWTYLLSDWGPWVIQGSAKWTAHNDQNKPQWSLLSCCNGYCCYPAHISSALTIAGPSNNIILWAPQLPPKHSVCWIVSMPEAQGVDSSRGQHSANNGWSWRANALASSSPGCQSSISTPRVPSGIGSQLSTMVAEHSQTLSRFPSLPCHMHHSSTCISWDICLEFFPNELHAPTSFRQLLLGYTM